MEKALVAQKVANRLFATEASVDGALKEATQLLLTLIEARGDANVSAVTGDETSAKVSEAIAALTAARSAVVAVHHDLADLKVRMGIRTKLIGVIDKPPSLALSSDVVSVRRQAS